MELLKEILNSVRELLSHNKPLILVCVLAALLLAVYFFSDPNDLLASYGIFRNLEESWIKLIIVLLIGFCLAALILFGISSAINFSKDTIKARKEKAYKLAQYECSRELRIQTMKLRLETLREMDRLRVEKMAENDEFEIIASFHLQQGVYRQLLQWEYLVIHSDLAHENYATYLVPLFRDVVRNNKVEKAAQ